MFAFFANIFGYVLNFFYELIGNYGVAIILFSIILKIVMLPISIKQQKTMKKSAKIQGQVKEIQEKYKNDPTRMNQEVMDLYKKENMSPFSGCLSSILQIILVLSMFFLVSKPLTHMRHIDKELLNSYTTQISEKSDGQVRYPEIAIIKEMSEEDENVRLNMDFLSLDLSDIPSQDYKNWKVYIIPALYVITSVISTKITTSMNKKAKEEQDSEKIVKSNEKPKEENKALKIQEEKEDKEIDTMEEMNKQMTLMMPIMAVSIALIAPLGLALYWLVSNILMIGERLIINKFFKDEEESDG